MKNMKKLAIMLVLAISLSGCSGRNSNTEYENENENNERFRKVYSGFSNGIYVDSETNVMYFWHSGGYSGGLTVMVDENGKPLIWEGSVAE